MDRNAANVVINDAAAEIASLTAAAHGLARGAFICSGQGNCQGAVRILLDIEPQLQDMQRLLDLASFAARRSGPADVT